MFQGTRVKRQASDDEASGNEIDSTEDYGSEQKKSPTERCHQPKSFAFCGSRTMAQTQWYWNENKMGCYPYPYCVAPGENKRRNSIENRFVSREECEEVCMNHVD